jgi:hypothetical protein
MIDMWNWLQDCCTDGYVTLADLEKVMKDDRAAKELWRDFSSDANDFIFEVRDQVDPFIRYLKKKEKGE